MSVPLLQHFLEILRRIFPHRLLRITRRYLWFIWCLLTRRDASKELKRAESKGNGIVEQTGCGCGSSSEELSVRIGKQDVFFKSEDLFSRNCQWVPPNNSAIVCASEIPSSLHPYSFDNPRATISSQELQRTNLQEDFGKKNLSYPRISHPTTSGQLHGSVTKLTASPAASISRVSMNGPCGETASRVSINIQQPDEEALRVADSPLPSTSRADQPINVPQLDTDPDRVSVLAPELTTEPGPMEGEEGIVGGYNLAPITTSPVEESGHTTLEAEVAGFRNKTLSEMCDDFHPMAPEIYYRYYKEDYIEPLVTTYELAPMTMRFQTRRLPHGWKEFLHHEGARYFLYESKRIYTDADIYNPSVQQHARRLINEFDEYTRLRNIVLTPNMNVVFDMFYDSEDDTCPCRYYIVDHTTRSVFWLDKFDADQLQVWEEVKGVTELTHIRHAIESQYWYHCHLFPDSFCMGEAEVDELKDIITYWICDVLTSQGSTLPYTLEELQPMLSLTNNLRKNLRSKRGVSAYARLMHLFARQRFLDFHGQPAVRLDRNKSIHQPANYVQPHSWLLGCLSPLMFSAPDTHCREINKIWVDRCVHKAAWNKFITNMNTEWQELILFGTVLLNANVAFLAIQSVDEATAVPSRSPGQILSFLSVVASIGSVIVGLMLARKNKVKQKEAATEAAIFLNSFEAERLGLETLAILYSVPYALLMWGVIFFLAAFSYYCFNGSILYVRLIVAGAWIIVSFLSLWCIFTLASWDSRFNAQKTAWDEVITAIKDTFYKTMKMTKQKLIDWGLRQPEQETPVLRLRSPARRLSEMWRKASRKATIFSALSAFGSGSGSRRMTEETEARNEARATSV
ncbi:hypothetical protein E1B28_010438 [Marasmius oreades]|uniref:Uncharacterized protein n=1 Tax=Marasmius oreades TaxID=181124 RepID=A0A9P7RYB3_9AGAR|nr:uncharacterized protein E1B28_010438 [Marasmius oreades]KAG7091401.1 hypothetical protein E1B28_010438 [Marasmius oreades]